MVAPIDRVFTFSVQACQSAQVLMQKTPGVFDKDTYQVMIGAQSNLMIYITDSQVGIN